MRDGGFMTEAEVIKETRGKYTWDNVCKRCRKNFSENGTVR